MSNTFFFFNLYRERLDVTWIDDGFMDFDLDGLEKAVRESQKLSVMELLSFRWCLGVYSNELRC